MNNALIKKCNKLISNATNKTLLYDDIITEINKNKDLSRYKCTIPNAIEYITNEGIKIIMPKPTVDKTINSIDTLDGPSDLDLDEKSMIVKEEDFIDDLIIDAIEHGEEIDPDDNNDDIEELSSEAANYYLEDGINWYLRQVSTIQKSLLTSEEEKALCIAAQNGDIEARNTMAKNNLKLVISISKRYARVNHSLDFRDIIQNGNLGLLKAIDKFDVNRGFKFSTYATWWIRQAITRSLSDEGRMIRIPVHAVEQLRYIKRAIYAINEMNDKHNAPLDYQQIAEYCNEHGLIVKTGKKDRKISANEVKTYLTLEENSNAISLFTPIGEDEHGEQSYIGDFIPDTSQNTEEYIEQVDLAEKFKIIFETYLTPREADVLRLRFGFDGNEPMTLEQVGHMFGITRERIRQIENKAKLKIKNNYKTKRLLL